IEQEVIRCTKKIAKLLRPEQNANMYSTLSVENRILKKQLENYHSQPNTRKKGKKIGERCEILKRQIKKSRRMCE
ncbi:7350_t:CDS:1, partial [Funneliformis geosporum]